MDKIKHSYVATRGLTLHVAEIGDGDRGAVVFLHGFPEIWYTWRYQMVAAADAGYRAIAPDCRGYGLSDQPADVDQKGSDWSDLVADLLAILDHLAIPKVFLVAKDFGVLPSNRFTLQYPERVSGMINIGIPYSPRKFSMDLLQEGFYIRRWREPNRAEEDFGRLDVKTVIRNVYILFSGSELPIAGEDQEIMDLVNPGAPLPHWFSEEDLAVYASLYENSGFSFPLQMPYRASFDELKVKDPIIRVPALLIVGEKDYFLKFPGVEDSIKSGTAKEFAPDLEIEFIAEGSHFVHEQFPGQVNQMIVDFMGSKKRAT